MGSTARLALEFGSWPTAAGCRLSACIGCWRIPRGCILRRQMRLFGGRRPTISASLRQLCCDLGGAILVLGSPQQRNLVAGIASQKGMAYAADVIQRVLPTLERTGTVLAVEPLSPAEGKFLCTAAEGRELVRRVGSNHCRLHLDCKAMASEPTPIRIDSPKSFRVGSLPRQRSESARPWFSPARFQADSRRPAGNRLRRLGVGRSIRSFTGKRANCTRASDSTAMPKRIARGSHAPLEQMLSAVSVIEAIQRPRVPPRLAPMLQVPARRRFPRPRQRSRNSC